MLNDTDDLKVLVNKWSSLFSLIIDKHAPIAELRVSEKLCPWIDKDLKNLCRPGTGFKKLQTKQSPQSLWTHIGIFVIRLRPGVVIRLVL